MKSKAKLYLVVLTAVFLLTEMLFARNVIIYGNDDIAGSMLKTVAFCLVIFFVYLGFKVARWILFAALVLFSIGCILAWTENEAGSFLVIAIYDLIFAIALLRSPLLKQLFMKDIENRASYRVEMPTQTGTGSEPVRVPSFKAPSLLRRYKAVLVDGILMMIVGVVIMVLIEDETTLRVVAILAVIFLYEPLATSYAATIGQRVMDLKVCDADNLNRRLPLWRSYVRFLVKLFLGWISLLTIHGTPERRAIHDYVSGSVVVRN